MDVLAHGLYGGVLAKAIKRKPPDKLNFWQTFFWGLFPDLFAFAIPFAWLVLQLLTGQMSLAEFPRPETNEPPAISGDAYPIFQIAATLYNYSHSLIIFAFVFIIAMLLFRRPIWELLGWFLHILSDIPTHTYQFYPTPVFWPVSGWKFDGFSWGTPWFMVANYTLLAILYIVLFRKRKLKETIAKPDEKLT